MKITNIVVLVSILVFIGAGYGYAEGLDALIEVGKSQGEIAKAYSDETKAYEGVKRAVEVGQIAKGANKKAILDKHGEPVVMVGDHETGREKWIYKPSTSDFGKGPRISLFFTKDDVLDEVSVEK